MNLFLENTTQKLLKRDLKSSLFSKRYVYLIVGIWYFTLAIPSLTTFSELIPGKFLLLVRLSTLLYFFLLLIYEKLIGSLCLRKNEIVAILVILVSGILSKDYHLVDLTLVSITLSKLYSKGYMKLLLGIMVAFLSITIVSSIVGLIDNRVFYRIHNENGFFDPRYSLGFVYTTLGSIFFMHIIILKESLEGNIKVPLIKIIAYFVLAFILFFYTDSRISFVLTILWLIYVMFKNYFNCNLLNISKKLGYLTLLVIVSYLLLTYLYNESYSILKIINSALSNRLKLGNLALDKYPLTLFGQYIKMNGNADIHYSTSTTINPLYFYIDSSFIQMLLKYGLCFSTLVIYKLTKFLNSINIEIIVKIAVIIFVFNGIVNPQFFELIYNPYLILIIFGGNYVRESETVS